MKNLAGVNEADTYILEELKEAGISIVRGQLNKGEVPYSLTGKVKGWKFTRAWAYWVANAELCDGLPLDVATKLYNKEYPQKGEEKPGTYGQEVRVAGHCGCPTPNRWAFPKDEVLMPLLEKSGLGEEITYDDLAKVCNEWKITGERFVTLYHIDTQEGLNEFVRTIKSI